MMIIMSFRMMTTQVMAIMMMIIITRSICATFHAFCSVGSVSELPKAQKHDASGYFFSCH